MSNRLSKSKILSGLQCVKRLWLETHRAGLIEISADTQRRFDAGNAVNDVARAQHAGGHLIGFDGGIAGAIRETREVMHAHPQAPVFEATFAHEGIAVRVDVLKKHGRGYRLIEVKSSTAVKPPHYPDCAVQAWVLEKCGVEVTRVELAHIDNRFVYRGGGDYAGLFAHADMSGGIGEYQAQVQTWAREFRGVLDGEQPRIATGAHCRDPYPCPFYAHCRGEETDAAFPLEWLPGSKVEIRAHAKAHGIDDLRDMPDAQLNERQRWVRDVSRRGEGELRADAAAAVAACAWPRYYLDFETVQFALPVWEGTRPYEQLPFQWSCHVESAPGEVTHAEFLHDGAGAPMQAFAESLLRAAGEDGAVFVYGSFEKTVLNQLAKMFPQWEEALHALTARLVDLLPLARANFYHPQMRGSWSLKNILPCIAPHLAYDDLGEVRDGTAAGAVYQEIIAAETETARREKLAEDLRAYCKRDTEALLALVHFFARG